MNVAGGMWQSMQSGAFRSGVMRVGFHVEARGLVAADAERVARAWSLPECGSWQSEHLTPAWYMRLCRNEPHS